MRAPCETCGKRRVNDSCVPPSFVPRLRARDADKLLAAAASARRRSSGPLGGQTIWSSPLGGRIEIPSGSSGNHASFPQMKAHFLIDAIVRQTTVLIAQLATAGGVRAPLAHVANQVFLDLAKELEAQGVSRKVGADMFGMALRAYTRKVRRLAQCATDQNRSLWEAVYDFVRGRDSPRGSRSSRGSRATTRRWCAACCTI